MALQSPDFKTVVKKTKTQKPTTWLLHNLKLLYFIVLRSWDICCVSSSSASAREITQFPSDHWRQTQRKKRKENGQISLKEVKEIIDTLLHRVHCILFENVLHFLHFLILKWSFFSTPTQSYRRMQTFETFLHLYINIFRGLCNNWITTQS